jgi:hypothetical protein
MADENNSNGKGLDSYQPLEKTYSPIVNRNYQPLIPTAVASQQPRPPVGDSGVPVGNSIPVARTPAATTDQQHSES